ncbi:MAG: hypothetical protein MH204_08355 [Fimbriimonadaceae bacterium]|nr:hypothetical protein [Fimbriimonadaceae bacterium]
MIRSAFLLLAAGCMTSAWAQVSLSLPPRPLSIVLRQLSETTGVQHRASGIVADRWVFVHVEDKPAASIRQALAAASGAEVTGNDADGWSFRGGFGNDAGIEAARVLLSENPPPPPLTAEEARETLLQMRPETGQEMGQNRLDAARLTRLWESGLDRRLGLRLLHILGPAELASIPDGESRVYSPNPNALQVPMPAGYLPAFQLLLQEMSLVRRVAPTIPQAEEGASYGVFGFSQMQFTQPLPTSALLVVQKMMAGMMSVSVVLRNERREMLSGNGGFQLMPRGSEFGVEPSEPDPLSQKLAALALPLEAEAGEKAFYTFIQSAMGGAGRAGDDLRQAGLQHLATVDRQEPLDGLPARGLRLIAREMGGSLVAPVSDLTWMYAGIGFGRPEPAGTLTTAGLATILAGGMGLSRSKEDRPQMMDGILVCRRGAIEALMPEPSDRRLIARVAQRLLQGGRAGLDSVADLSLLMADGGESPFVTIILQGFMGAGLMTGADPDLLAAYGSLSTAERAAARGPQGFILQGAALAAPGRSRIMKLLGPGNAMGGSGWQPPRPRPGEEERTEMSRMEEAASNLHVTDRYGDRLGRAALRFRVTNEVVWHMSNNQQMPMMEMDINRIGWQILAATDPEQPDFAQYMGTPQTWRFVQAPVERLTVELAGVGPIVARVAAVPDLAGREPLVGIAALPAEFKAEIAAWLKENSRNYGRQSPPSIPGLPNP